MERNKLSLCFVRFIGEENDGMNRYEFIFTDNADEVWGEDFDQHPACLCNDLMVYDEYVKDVRILKTKIKLELAQNSCCFGMQDFFDGICAIAWEDISTYDEYPSDGRLFFRFGETLEEVEEKLAIKNILFDK